MRFIAYAEMELERLNRLLHRYENAASDVPGVKLYCRRDGGRIRYYITTPENPEKTYIGFRKQGELLSRLLARKKALETTASVRQNMAAIEQMLRAWKPLTELLAASDDEDVSQHPQKTYPPSGNPFKRNELIHDTGLGFFTRSKSEAILAHRLHSYGLWFEYEAPLRIRDLQGRWKTIYPDFTIYLDDGRIIYLEHVGMLQNEGYQQSFLTKVLEYHKNDYLLCRDVFITMDGPEGDIDIGAIDTLIHTF